MQQQTWKPKQCMKITVRFVCEECDLETIRNNHKKAEKTEIGKSWKNIAQCLLQIMRLRDIFVYLILWNKSREDNRESWRNKDSVGEKNWKPENRNWQWNESGFCRYNRGQNYLERLPKNIKNANILCLNFFKASYKHF